MNVPLSPPQVIQILHRVAFLKPLSTVQLHRLAKCARIRSYPAGSRLILEGTYGSTFFIVVQGEVEAYKRSNGEKIILGRDGAGSIWGEMGLVDHGFRTATVETTQRSLVIEIDKPTFDRLLSENGAVASYVIREMNKRLRRTDSRMVDDLLAMNADLLAARRELEATYDKTLAALSAALDLRDSETEGHSQRVTAYSLALGQSLSLEAGEIKALHRGALLHDIGKIGVPDAILLKPDRLVPEERALICQHPVWGASLLGDIHFLLDALPVVRHHHEWWDGSGYPDGLRGEEIPLYARVFAIADTFDALTSERPYRPASLPEEAMAIMRREVGTHLDPDLFEHFEGMFKRVIEPMCLEFRQKAPRQAHYL